MKEIRYVNLISATGEIRSATFDGKEHVVVPVVALVEGIIQASNSSVPELVLKEEFGKAPGGWNGRPVVVDHPQVNGEPVSANLPQVLEREKFGQVFNTDIDGKRLVMEAFLDPSRASDVGEKALEMMQRIADGEVIEVSVGAFIISEAADGEVGGKKFKAIWREIVPDHLAFLSSGSTGACSVDMGCGTPRVASVYKVTSEGLELVEKEGEEEPMKDDKKSDQSLLRQFAGRVRELFRPAQDGETSDIELRDVLDRALRAGDASFAFIEAVFAKEKQVVYGVFSSVDGGGIQFFRRSFKSNEDGSVALAESKEEVRPVTRFEAMEEGTPSCSCGRQLKENRMEKGKIDALIADENNPLKEEDRAWLETAPDSAEALLAAPPPAPEPKAEVKPEAKPEGTPEPKAEVKPEAKPEPKPEPVAASTPKTAEEYVAAAPVEIREMLQSGLKANAAKREAVITALKANEHNPFTDEQLAAKSMEELEQLASLAQVKTYSSRPVPREEKTDDNAVPAPPSLADAIKASRAS